MSQICAMMSRVPARPAMGRQMSRISVWSWLPVLTSPQSNLRRVRRSSADKTNTRIANYWDRTALACCRHSKHHRQLITVYVPTKNTIRQNMHIFPQRYSICFVPSKQPEPVIISFRLAATGSNSHVDET